MHLSWLSLGLPPVPETIWQSWTLSPAILGSLLLAAALYARGVHDVWRQAGAGRAISLRRVLAFALGLLALFVTLVSPLDAWGEALFSAHMVQHLFLTLLAAPLLVYGLSPAAVAWATPRRLRRPLLRFWHDSRHIARIWSILSHPGAAWALFAAAIWLWHLPLFYEAALGNEILHALEHVTFLMSAMLFWWTVGRRGKEALGTALFMLFTTALHNGLLGALLTFSPRPWYGSYAILPYAWGLTPLQDQQLAGVIMWIPASLVYLGAILLLFGRRLATENGGTARVVRPGATKLLLPLLVLALTACAERAEEINFWELSLGDAAAGKEAIGDYGCHTCHTIPGIPAAQGMVGPPLTGWSERHTIAGSLPNIPENLVRWLMNPQEIEPGTAMPDMGVSEEDARDIAAYLYSLGEGLTTASGNVLEQPVPFSHQYHVQGVGLDCRYCHTSVTESSFAGMPSTRTCMTCHSQILVNSPLLAGVQQSWQQGAPIPWVRIYNLHDTVHFDHAAHVRVGVGCDVCHGRVDEMQVTEHAVSMTMSWCLECHRDPAQFLRPRDEVFNMAWEPPPNQHELGAGLVREQGIRPELLTDCSLCHY